MVTYENDDSQGGQMIDKTSKLGIILVTQCWPGRKCAIICK